MSAKRSTAFVLLHDPFEQIYADSVTVLASFCSVFDSCLSGSGTGNGVILGRHGEIFGTAQFGGAQDSGTVFELAPP